MVLSQDEARLPLVPTLRATLGVQGYRPTVGTWDNKEQGDGCAALHGVTGQTDDPPTVKTGQSKQQRLQMAFAAHRRDSAHTYPASPYAEGVITIENAPWPLGARMEQVLAAHLPLRVKRLPSYSPQRNVLERFWRVMRRRATPNRLFAHRVALRATLRNNTCDYQSMRQKVLSLRESPRKTKKEAKLAAA